MDEVPVAVSVRLVGYDTICDWGSWIGSRLDGDFTLSKTRIVYWTLCAIFSHLWDCLISIEVDFDSKSGQSSEAWF